MEELLESCDLETVCTGSGGSVALLNEYLEKLQDWLNLQPHLPHAMPKNVMRAFIIRTKFSLEIAKQKVDMYYTLRRLIPDFFTDRDPAGPALMRYFKTTPTQMVPLPKLTPEKYRVLIHRHVRNDYENYNAEIDFKYSLMLADAGIGESLDLGEVYVFDTANCTVGHLTKPIIPTLKKADIVAREAYAARIKAVHIINVTSFMTSVINMIKSIIPPKIAGRVHVHTAGAESLYEYIPKSILPKEYGGDERSMDELSNLWREKIFELRSWFLEQENEVADESRRPGPMPRGDDLFGISGSFRKLDVD